ncbi:MAG: heme exporter protein CcmD [Kiloniellales bacterium]
MLEFLGMGGYAAFVWPAYILTAVVLIGLLVMSLRDARAREAALRSIDATLPHRARGPSGDA